MGRNLQLRGTLQVVELRTMNPELNELIKEEVEEVDYRSEKALKVAGGTVDLEVTFTDAGIDKARYLMIRADQIITVRYNSLTSAALPTIFAIHMGEVAKIYISTTVETQVKIIAAK